MTRIFLLFAVFLVAGCASPQQKATEALQRAHSMVAGGAFTSEAWLSRSVPATFAANAFESIAQDLQPLVEIVSPSNRAGIRAAHRAALEIHSAIARGDRPAVVAGTQVLARAGSALARALPKQTR